VEKAKIMKEAEDKGVYEQVKAGLRALAVAPADTVANVLGTAAPAIAATLAAVYAAAPTAVVTGVAATAGMIMGAGTIKGTIYEETKKALIEVGVSSKQAEERAELAQKYNGKNLDMILMGTALGGLAGTVGLEAAVAKAVARRIISKYAAEEAAKLSAVGIAKELVKAGFKEGTPEFLQAFQEAVAGNVAQQREGFDVPTYRGAVTQATMEAGTGVVLGSGFRGVQLPGQQKQAQLQADQEQAQSRSEAIRRMSPDYQDAAMVSPRETSARAAAADQLLQNYEQETRTGSPEQRNALIAAYQTDLGLPLDVATAMVDQQLAATQPPPPAAPPPAPPPAGAGPNQVTDIPAGVDPQRVADIELELINYGVEPAAARIGAINRAAQEAKDDAEANAAATQQEAPSATVSTDGTAPSGGGVAATLQQQPGASTEGITDAQSGGVDGAQPVVTQSATGEGAQPGALNNYVYKGPKDIPQNIWDLHQAARLAVDVANGHKYHPSQIGGGRPISSGQLKRNQTMSFRRLNNAVKAYLPNDQEAQLKLMRDLNVESRRREEEAGTDAQSGGVDGAQPVVTQSATGEGAQPGALVPRQAAVSFDGRKGIVGNEAVLGGLRRVVADDDVALDNPSRVGAVMLTGIDRQAGGSAGRASEVLTALTNWADISNERIILSPAASGDLKQPELVKWYERNGFTTTPDGLMERNPSTTEQTTGTITPAAKPTTPSDPITLINQYASQTGAERRATYAQLRNKSPEELQSAIQTLQAERQKLLSKDGKRPAKNSEKAKLWVDLTDKGDLLTTICPHRNSHQQRLPPHRQLSQSRLRVLRLRKYLLRSPQQVNAHGM
jgi:hypothetical protein